MSRAASAAKSKSESSSRIPAPRRKRRLFGDLNSRIHPTADVRFTRLSCSPARVDQYGWCLVGGQRTDPGRLRATQRHTRSSTVRPSLTVTRAGVRWPCRRSHGVHACPRRIRTFQDDRVSGLLPRWRIDECEPPRCDRLGRRRYASGHQNWLLRLPENQGPFGIAVYDQYRTPPSPKAVGPRTLRWGAPRDSNNGDKFLKFTSV